MNDDIDLSEIEDMAINLEAFFILYARKNIPEKLFRTFQDIDQMDYDYLLGCAEREGLIIPVDENPDQFEITSDGKHKILRIVGVE